MYLCSTKDKQRIYKSNTFFSIINTHKKLTIMDNKFSSTQLTTEFYNSVNDELKKLVFTYALKGTEPATLFTVPAAAAAIPFLTFIKKNTNFSDDRARQVWNELFTLTLEHLPEAIGERAQSEGTASPTEADMETLLDMCNGIVNAKGGVR